MRLVLENISKRYGDTEALSGVSLSLESGIYGLLGPNGAGKTTLMRIMTDLLKPTEGRVLLDGREIAAMGRDFRRRLGYLPQEFGFYPSFSVEQFLLYLAGLKGLPRTEAKKRTNDLLETVGLYDKRGQKMKGLSGGQRQRVGIVQALLGDPDVLVLDEPTAGLDPEERIRFRGIISGLSRQKIVLLSTHIVSDLEAAANEIILLKKGHVLGVQKPHDLLAELEGMVWTVSVSAEEERELAGRYPCSNILHDGGMSVLRLIAKEKPHPDAAAERPNMEDMYLFYFGKQERM